MKVDEMKQKKIISRITLSDASQKAISNWYSQAKEQYPGIKVSDSDLVNWLIVSHPPELTPEELTNIESQFFDEVKKLEWMLSQAKLAKQKKTLPF